MTAQTAPTAKQALFLSALAGGKTPAQAMDAAGVSRSPENRGTFLLRLVSGQHVALVPVRSVA